MPSVLAIVSKAVFEKMVGRYVALGDLVSSDRYVSGHAAFSQVGPGDAIFLVTVRPPNEALWLVAVIEDVKRSGDAWVGVANKQPIKDITATIKLLKFATGTGIAAKTGALGMSLQTPRVLTAGDLALLRGRGKAMKPSPAVAEYRRQVDQTPAAKKARAQAKAAAGGEEILRLVNHRRPFTMLDELAPPQQKQLAKLTRQNQAGKPADLVEDEDWAPMVLVDVLDVASSTVTHQLYVWSWGSGELFVHDTTKRAAVIIQHGFDQEVDDVPFRKALAAAYARARPSIDETIDFRLDRAPVPPPLAAEVDAQKQVKTLLKRLRSELGKSRERYRLFEELTAAQRAVVAEALAIDGEQMWQLELASFGLPPAPCLKAWAGIEPATVLERRVGKWPVWRWLEAAAARDIDQIALIKALGKALDAAQITELCMRVCDGDRYDLFREDLEDQRGESAMNAFHLAVIRLLGALIDSAGEAAALAFAAAAKKKLVKEVEFWLAAIACFALVARARRRGEIFPNEFLKLAVDADFLGNGANLVEGFRDIAEVMTPAQREKLIIGDGGPFFNAGYNDDIKNGKRVEVPKLSSEWLIADLAPTEKVVGAMVASIFNWDHDKKPTQLVLDTFSKVGEVAIPHLRAALRKKTPYKKLLEQALARLEKQHPAPAKIRPARR